MQLINLFRVCRKGQLQNTPVMKISVLQFNADRVRAAHDLLPVTALKYNIDLIILAEPNRKLAEAAGWERDRRGDAAVLIYNKALTVDATIKGNGFIGLRLTTITVYSCYISPNCTFDEYKRDLDELGESVGHQRGKILVAGDFNAASTMWGSKYTNKRGQYLMEVLADLDLTVANTGESPTFERGNRSSRPDITLINSNLAGKVTNWRVLEEESMSGHKYIVFNIGEKIPTNKAPSIGWNLNKINRERFEETLKNERIKTPVDLVAVTTLACHKSMPKRKVRRKQTVYWWNEEIATSREKCLKCRRAYTRANSKIKRVQREEDKRNQEKISVEAKNKYKAAKLDLKILISKSKGDHWQKVNEEVDKDVWGLGYKIVMKKLYKSPSAPISLDKMCDIAKVLFPTHGDFVRIIRTPKNVPKITDEELAIAASRIKLRKAPGPDEIAPELVKLATKVIPEKITSVMSSIFLNGEFPAIWKAARLILLRKNNKPADEPTGYRPLCLLDCYGKLLERLLLNRIEQMLPDHGGLADQQYGFRSGRSTLNAIEKVKTIAEAAKQGTQRTRKLCVLVALDVRNAFNSAPWSEILREFRKRDFPEYICNLINSYLDQRSIVITDTGGLTKTVNVTSGVPQGSILGPTLWNILYDGVFKLNLGEEAHLIGFADDLALVVAARTDQHLIERTNRALKTINGWMVSKQLQLAPEKTEAIMLSGRKKHGLIRFNIEGVQIEPGENLKYLGVWLDKNLKFDKHVVETTAKAEKLTAALSQIMPRKGGPRASKRKIIASVAHSVMLYGAPVWGQILKMAKYNDMLSKIQRRLAIRICGAYRTISKEAVLAIAGVIPIEKLVTERTRQYRRVDHKTTEEERQKTIEEWGNEWKERGKGQWTRDLIQDLPKWLNRKHGEVDKWMTQALSGHGVFNTYLHAIGKAASDNCPYCDEEDTPHHAIFECKEFEDDRRIASGEGEVITKETLVPLMLNNKEEWSKCAKMLRTIIGRRIKDELERQKINEV